ncbi:transposase [Pseudomonas chlororaphis]
MPEMVLKTLRVSNQYTVIVNDHREQSSVDRLLLQWIAVA